MSYGLYDDGYMSSGRDIPAERERERILERQRGDCRTEAEKIEYKKRYCASCWHFCKYPKSSRSHCELGRGIIHKKRPASPKKGADLWKYFDNYRHRIIQSGRVKACEYWNSCIKIRME